MLTSMNWSYRLPFFNFYRNGLLHSRKNMQRFCVQLNHTNTPIKYLIMKKKIVFIKAHGIDTVDFL